MDRLLDISALVAAFDILIVAVVLYWVMRMFKGTRAERMIWGLCVMVIVYFLSARVELITLHWLLSNFLGSIVIFVIVVFQQDIRRALIQVGKTFSMRDYYGSAGFLDELVKAASAMSRSRIGGIIAVERSVDLSDFIEVGTEIDAAVSKELILSLFNPASPLHDGAVVIKGGRIHKAGCILPLADRELPSKMGTRHRAAVGLSDESDAAVIVVSGESGEVSLVTEGNVEGPLSEDALSAGLKGLFSKAEAKRAILPWKAGA